LPFLFSLLLPAPSPSRLILSKAYKSSFGKSYESEAEESRRYEVFMQNMQMAAELNADESDAEYGMTVMSDRFPEEINTHLEIPEHIVREDIPIVEAPTSFDARNKGWVPAVRNQGQCGSCWAFATAAVMEINYAKKHGGSPLVLSEQQIVDCDTSNSGCGGGWPIQAATYAKRGLMLDADYPYTARAGTCRYVASKTKVSTSTTGDISGNVNSMKDAVYNNGAIVVLLNADKMQVYSSGIMDASNCPARTAHAVVVVGWGVSGSTEYWIVRNSWGSYWGENGYCRIVTGKNACGIEQWPEYIIVN